MTNQAKSEKNNDVFLNFVADLQGSRGYKISDNFFLSLNFARSAHMTCLLKGLDVDLLLVSLGLIQLVSYSSVSVGRFLSHIC